MGLHAVIIGASMAGLGAARVLADHFEQVTLIERDQLIDAATPRKGVPQGRHLHGLLCRGEELIGALFPDLMPALLAGGAVPIEWGRDTAWYHFGAWKSHVDKGLMSTFCSRPFLEAEVRRRVLALPNVRLLDDWDVNGLQTDAARRRVTGLAVQRRDGSSPAESVAADLVVDASGRGSRMPLWLTEIGRPRVQESTVKVDVGYATRIFARPADGTHPWKMMYILGQSPQSRRLGALAPIEGGRWIAVMAGLLGDHPPADEAGWLEYARNLPVPDLYDVLKVAQPEGDIATYKFPAHLRRHYERMDDFPDGLVVLGDAHCSFNPIYGQGMTVALIGAHLLGEQLVKHWARRGSGNLSGFSAAYQKALAKRSDEPWMMSTGEDLRYPEVVGDRPLGSAAMQWFTARVHRLAATDAEIALLFYRAMQMVGSVSELLRPAVVLRVLKGPA